MKITVVCAPGIGDALIFHIASFHLKKQGHKVATSTPHRFGKWLSSFEFGDPLDADAVFLQHDNTFQAEQIRQTRKNVYTFYGSYHPSKHAPLKPGFDYVADLNRTMVDNVILSLRSLFGIEADGNNGFHPPEGVIHRNHRKRVAIHSTSGDPSRNWPEKKFRRIADWLESEGFSPCFLPLFSNLEELASFIYESGYFVGNDSGPGHIASCLGIPHLIIGRGEKHMRHWRPGWSHGEIITPASWIPNWKGWRFRETQWKRCISSKRVIKKLKTNILNHHNDN